MNHGWIKLHRQMTRWEWYQDSNTFRLFIHLLLLSNHEDNKWRGIIIKRGELITGRKSLSKDLMISEQQIRTSLKRLKSTSELTIKTTNKFSLIKLNNYNKYQQTNQQTNQQLTTNKNDKNLKNIYIYKNKAVDNSKKPYIEGDKAYQKDNGDWYVITYLGEHKKYIGDIKNNLIWK